MAFQWIRRVALLGSAAAALLLASCGGGTVASQFHPSRVIAFGDGMADVGQDGSRYTVNDGTVNIWPLWVATVYGLPLVPSSQGGLGYAWGNARVTDTPDAAGNSSTPTVAQQIDSFLASNTLNGDDLVIVSAGTSDVITQVQATLNGAQTSDQMTANTNAAGRALGAQVLRLVSAGAKHVLLAGTYDLGRSPWANQMGTDALLHPASQEFNNGLLVSLVNAGANVLYVDFALYFNQQTSSSSNTANHTDLVCTSVDPGPGIGTGNGQVNSHLCDALTILPLADYNTYLFADRVYPTPRGHQLFGDYAQGQLKNRW
jgi:phospholipase/lecithinase/hemolysin